VALRHRLTRRRKPAPTGALSDRNPLPRVPRGFDPCTSRARRDHALTTIGVDPLHLQGTQPWKLHSKYSSYHPTSIQPRTITLESAPTHRAISGFSAKSPRLVGARRATGWRWAPMRFLDVIFGPDHTMYLPTADEIAIEVFEDTIRVASEADYGRAHDEAYSALSEQQRDLLFLRFQTAAFEDLVLGKTARSRPGRPSGPRSWLARVLVSAFRPVPSNPMLSSLAVQAMWTGFGIPFYWGPLIDPAKTSRTICPDEHKGGPAPVG
jgi:hypothetical protein